MNSQVAVIYSQGGKTAEAEKAYKTVDRKLGQEKEVWTKFAVFYYGGQTGGGGTLLDQTALTN